MKHYQVIDTQTGDVASAPKTFRCANRNAERKNQEYGAVRFTVRYLDTLLPYTVSAIGRK